MVNSYIWRSDSIYYSIHDIVRPSQVQTDGPLTTLSNDQNSRYASLERCTAATAAIETTESGESEP